MSYFLRKELYVFHKLYRYQTIGNLFRLSHLVPYKKQKKLVLEISISCFQLPSETIYW